MAKLTWIILASACLTGAQEAPCYVEGQCQPSSVEGNVLICASRLWQSQPIGTFQCINGSLVPSSIAGLTSSTLPSIASLSEGGLASLNSASVINPSISNAPIESGSSLLPAPSTTLKYQKFTGNGSTQAGWPPIQSWVSYETMFAKNANAINESCAGDHTVGQTNHPVSNSEQETSDLNSTLIDMARKSGLDERFLLAIVMQESQGCVRVPTTWGTVRNPGLMQTHDGNGTCNDNNATTPIKDLDLIKNPCPSTEIEQMIYDGTFGTSAGAGLLQLMHQQRFNGTARWYRTARFYNSGNSSIGSGVLEDIAKGDGTPSYSSDIANKLLGYVGTRPPNLFNSPN